MSKELKPCPFCGELEHISEEDGYTFDKETYPKCGKCTHNAQAKIDSATWNTRPIEDALNARVAELESALFTDETNLKNIGLEADIRRLEEQLAEAKMANEATQK